MSLSLWIPADQQFGEPVPGEARRGATRQAVAETIKRHLFRETESGAEANFTYDRLLLAFAKELQPPLSSKARPSAQALWSTLCPAQDSPITEADQVPAQVEAAFCFSVQGLCSALARGWSGMAHDANDDEEEDAGEENPDDSSGAPPTPPDPAALRFRIEHQEAVTAISALVRLVGWRGTPAPSCDTTTQAEDARLAARVLLDTLLATLADLFAIVDGTTEVRGGKPYTLKWIELRKPDLAQRIESLLKELPFRFTVQPLKKAVAYRFDESCPSDGNEKDYFRVDLIGYRRTNRFLRELHAGFRHNRPHAFERYVEAVNLQQAVPWRINRPLLQWAWRLSALAAGTDRADADGSTCPDLRDWVREDFYQPSPSGGGKIIERPGEFLDSPLAARALAELCPDQGTPPTFYLPWKADYRGRLYAETPWLTPQGGDLQRAVLEFARGQVLDERGISALRRHGANLVKTSRLLADLAITDRQVVTLAERERWVREHEQEIFASARSPLTESFWREAAKKKKTMQFLAFCLAYRQWKEAPESPIHLPVQIDGTCNGLQHIAALTGDKDLARSVNVLPQEDGMPGNIYSELAELAASSLGGLSFRGNDAHRLGLELADRWIAASETRRCWLERETAKRVVMTIPYGAGETAQARKVLEKIAAEVYREWCEERGDKLDGWKELVAWKNDKASPGRRTFVARCCRGLFKDQLKDLRKLAFSAEDEVVRETAYHEWEHVRVLGAYAALAIVRHLRTALSSRYPSVDAFSDWLKRKARASAGLPLLWLTPLGFPVCQDKFRVEGSSLTARIGSRTVRIEVQRLSETVDAEKQKDALLPNLIHSLDATHLALTLESAKAQGMTDIGSIHDCLLCRPNAAFTLGAVVRQAFVALYDPDDKGIPRPLALWRDWMDLLARLRTLRHVSGVLGALDQPDGYGEQMLRGQAPENADAKEALEILAELRRLDPPRRYLARRLLEFLQENPVPALDEWQQKAGRPFGKGKKPNKHFTAFDTLSAGLPLGKGTELSDYFFS